MVNVVHSCFFPRLCHLFHVLGDRFVLDCRRQESASVDDGFDSGSAAGYEAASEAY